MQLLSSPKLRLLLVSLLAMLSGGCATTGWQGIRHPLAIFDRQAPASGPATGSSRKPTLLLAPHRIWKGDGVAGAPSITISLGEQRAYFFRAGHLVGETDISSGRDGFDTPPGDYHVIQKDKDHRSTLYGDFVDGSGVVVKTNVDTSKQSAPEGASFLGAKMPFFLRFQSGYGLHAGKLPGHRASHGCVRLPLAMAEHFYLNAEVGTPVKVRP